MDMDQCSIFRDTRLCNRSVSADVTPQCTVGQIAILGAYVTQRCALSVRVALNGTLEREAMDNR